MCAAGKYIKSRKKVRELSGYKIPILEKRKELLLPESSSSLFLSNLLFPPAPKVHYITATMRLSSKQHRIGARNALDPLRAFSSSFLFCFFFFFFNLGLALMVAFSSFFLSWGSPPAPLKLGNTEEVLLCEPPVPIVNAQMGCCCCSCLLLLSLFSGRWCSPRRIHFQATYSCLGRLPEPLLFTQKAPIQLKR